MTPEQRWEAGFEITNEVGQRMLAGAMWKLKTDDIKNWCDTHGTREHLTTILESLPPL